MLHQCVLLPSFFCHKFVVTVLSRILDKTGCRNLSLSFDSESTDYTQSWLDFESKEDVDSLHLPLCKSKELEEKFCYSCQSFWESSLDVDVRVVILLKTGSQSILVQRAAPLMILIVFFKWMWTRLV